MSFKLSMQHLYMKPNLEPWGKIRVRTSTQRFVSFQKGWPCKPVFEVRRNEYPNAVLVLKYWQTCSLSSWLDRQRRFVTRLLDNKKLHSKGQSTIGSINWVNRFKQDKGQKKSYGKKIRMFLTGNEFFGRRFGIGGWHFPHGEIIETHHQVGGHQFLKLA